MLTLTFGLPAMVWFFADRARLSDAEGDPAAALAEMRQVIPWTLLGMALFAVGRLWAPVTSLSLLRQAKIETQSTAQLAPPLIARSLPETPEDSLNFCQIICILAKNGGRYKWSHNSLNICVYSLYHPRMFERDARRLDHKTSTELRKRAVASSQEGQSPAGVARALGVTCAAAYICPAL